MIEDVRISGGGNQIDLYNAFNFSVRRNFLLGGSLFSVATSATCCANGIRGFVEDNTIRDGTIGIAINTATGPEGVAIRGNIVDAQFGIDLSQATGGLIEGNTVLPSFGSGISSFLSSGISVVNNRVIGNGSNGPGMSFSACSDFMVTDNISRNNGESGIFVLSGSSGLTLERNQLNSNGDFGLEFSLGTNNNRYGRNTAWNNAGNQACTGTTCVATSDLCDEGTGNVSFGDNLMPGPPPC